MNQNKGKSRMEALKKRINELLSTKGEHLPLLQGINEEILKNYAISLGNYLTVLPKDVEIYYVNKKAPSPYVDMNMQCVADPKTNEQIWALQSGRFGQLYFHMRGSGGIDICLSDNKDYALCCTLKAVEINGEEIWSAQKTRNRFVEILCEQEGLADKAGVMEWINRPNSLPMLRRRENCLNGEVYHLRRKGLRFRDKTVLLPLRSFMDLWNKKLALNNVQKLMIYLNLHPEADVLQVLREHQFRYIPSEVRIRYKLDRKVKLYE